MAMIKSVAHLAATPKKVNSSAGKGSTTALGGKKVTLTVPKGKYIK